MVPLTVLSPAVLLPRQRRVRHPDAVQLESSLNVKKLPCVCVQHADLPSARSRWTQPVFWRRTLRAFRQGAAWADSQMLDEDRCESGESIALCSGVTLHPVVEMPCMGLEQHACREMLRVPVVKQQLKKLLGWLGTHPHFYAPPV